MDPEILSLKSVRVSDAISRCADALLHGQLLVLPTETVYGIGTLASNVDAVNRLCIEKERRLGHPLSLAVSGFEMVNEYIPQSSPIVKRLTRIFWPGPLTLVVATSRSEGKLRAFPKEALDLITLGETCGFRSPQNDFLLSVIREVSAPIVLTSANISGQASATTVQEAIKSLGNRIDLFVDGGPATLGKPSTVVKIEGKEITTLREGVIPSDSIKMATLKTIMFVCTADRRRSPLAVTVAKVILGKALNAPPEKLENYGFRITSSGTNVNTSLPATETVNNISASDYRVSLKQHRSQRVTLNMLKESDLVFTMEKAHRDLLQLLYPTEANRIMTLNPNGQDVGDLYGTSIDEHRACARLIESLIEERLSTILSNC